MTQRWRIERARAGWSVLGDLAVSLVVVGYGGTTLSKRAELSDLERFQNRLGDLPNEDVEQLLMAAAVMETSIELEQMEGVSDDPIRVRSETLNLLPAAQGQACRWQANEDGQMFCSASTSADPAVKFSRGSAHYAPTTLADCQPCSIPSSLTVCDALVHPEVESTAVPGSAETRVAIRARCSDGHAEAKSFERCTAGGHACWHREVIVEEPAAKASPQTGVAVETMGMSTSNLIEAGESGNVEYKQTARYNTRTGSKDPDVEHSVVKTVAGFLNVAGGTLLLGVHDEQRVTGLTDDYKLCGNKGRDGFENWLTTKLIDELGKPAVASFVRMALEKVNDEDVCRVDVMPSSRPVYAGKDQRFYLRVGNSTRELKVREAHDYINVHWPAAGSSDT